MWSISRKSMMRSSMSAQFGLFAARAAQVEQRVEHVGLQVCVAAELDVVEHRHAAKQRDVLEAAPQAHAGALRRGNARDVLALEPDAAARGPVEARDGVEQRGLARAVGPDHGGDGARLHIKADASQCLHAAEGQRYAVNLQQGGGGRGATRGLCRHRLVCGFVRTKRTSTFT
jgi:hypothetical protein